MALFGWENADMAQVYTRKSCAEKSGQRGPKMSKGIIPGDLRVRPLPTRNKS